MRVIYFQKQEINQLKEEWRSLLESCKESDALTLNEGSSGLLNVHQKSHWIYLLNIPTPRVREIFWNRRHENCKSQMTRNFAMRSCLLYQMPSSITNMSSLNKNNTKGHMELDRGKTMTLQYYPENYMELSQALSRRWSPPKDYTISCLVPSCEPWKYAYK